MPKFKYVGPHDAVDIPGVGTVKRDAVIDVPAAVNLEGRDDFAAMTTKKES